MLFDIPFVADWHKIGEHRQSLIDPSNKRENNWCIDDYKVGDKVLVEKEVSSAKQSPRSMAKSHGLSQQSIKIELSGFNAEPKQMA